jgi:hypothetical protein
MLKINMDKAILFKINLIFGITYLLLGCSQSIIPDAQDSEIPSPVNPQLPETQQVPSLPTIGDATQMSQPVPTVSDPGLQGLIEKAKEDLAERLAISANEIILLEATSVVWPDASLGCPQEGMAYAQVLTPGYLIRLEFGNQEFEYHASKGTYIIYCENPTPPVPGAPVDI